MYVRECDGYHQDSFHQCYSVAERGGARLFIAILDVLHFECVGTVQDEVSNSVKELDFDHFAVHYEFVRFSQIALLQLLHHK